MRLLRLRVRAFGKERVAQALQSLAIRAYFGVRTRLVAVIDEVIPDVAVCAKAARVRVVAPGNVLAQQSALGGLVVWIQKEEARLAKQAGLGQAHPKHLSQFLSAHFRLEGHLSLRVRGEFL